jgi:acyl-CoA thioesterase
MPKEFPSKVEGFDPFGGLIGLRLTRAKDGSSQFVLEVDGRLLNPHGTLHGGVAYSMADTGMGAALYTRMEPDELCATIEIKISYFKAVTSGTLTCDTRVVHRGKTIATLESEVSNDGQLVAKALGTYSVFKDKRSANL